MRKRFFRAATVSIIAGLLIAFLFAVPLMQQVYTDEIRERLTAVLALTGEMETPDEALPETIARLSSRLAEEEAPVRLTVLDGQGRVLADSAADAGEMENHADRPEIRAAVMSGAGEDVRWSTTTGRCIWPVGSPERTVWCGYTGRASLWAEPIRCRAPCGCAAAWESSWGW